MNTDITDTVLEQTLALIASRSRLPESTYRLQFHTGFTFADAAAITGYLADLGVTHCYASPYLKAGAGSTHGYDVVDPHQLNPEIGSPADYERWIESLSERGLSHILDTVPNHMGVGTNDNAWWNDALKHGRGSKYADFFDIAWRGSPRAELRDKVLLPVLGEPYGDVLEKGQLRIEVTNGEPALVYYERRFPISPASVEGRSEAQLRELNGDPNDPHSFDALDGVLSDQHYRLAYWRVAPDEINYRRFFDINDLAALCMERLDVFEAAHELILRLLGEGKIAGLRIDHPDGLYDPEQYFRRLQQHYILACAKNVLAGDPQFRGQNWDTIRGGLLDGIRARETSSAAKALYVVAEKILAAGEPLPANWAVHGTSGYDFLIVLNGLFVDTESGPVFTRKYGEWIDDDKDFARIAYEKKRLVLQISLASELQMLAHQLDRLAQSDRHSRDFSLTSLHDALREIIACFPVYRSYIADGDVADIDRRHIDAAVAEAIERNPRMDPAVFEFIRQSLLLNFGGKELAAQQRRFAGKFQQVTAPVTAKGIEDTSFYVYNRLISLNEVGGAPENFGTPPDEVHRYFAERQALWPYALSCLSTHDTKRSEDVRARINVLSEIPDQWWSAVARWSRLNEPHRRRLGDLVVPDANEELLLYQTLVGAWPLEPHGPEEYSTFIQRIKAYMEKALREAKVHTSWTNPNADYDKAVAEFIELILDDKTSGAFLADIRSFQRRISHFGMLSSLSQTLVRLAAPGAPDTYQGTEIWDFSLVDPDNRRPVDYPRRAAMLRELRIAYEAAGAKRPQFALELARQKEDARCKLLVTWRTLNFRRKNPGLLTAGSYVPLAAAGPRADSVFAFLRSTELQASLVVVPRLTTHLVQAVGDLPLGRDVWQDTRLILPAATESQQFENLFTGETIAPKKQDGQWGVSVGEILGHFPVALLSARS